MFSDLLFKRKRKEKTSTFYGPPKPLDWKVHKAENKSGGNREEIMISNDEE